MSIASVSASPGAGIAQQLQNQAHAQAVQAAATAQTGAAAQTAAVAQAGVAQQIGQARHLHHHGDSGTAPTQQASTAPPTPGGSRTLDIVA